MRESPRTSTGFPTEPPPIRQYGLGRKIILVGCGVIASLALMLVVMNIEPPHVQDITQRAGLGPITEIVPQPVDPDEMLSAGDVREQTDVALERGGTLQFTNEDGRVIQLVKATRLLPRPNDVLEMQDPSAVFFLAGNRIVTIEGDRGRAIKRGNKMIESGRITGNVRIRFFENADGRRIEYEHHPPTILILAEEAEFDHVHGEIRCPGAVTVRTDTVEFHGRNLAAVYDQEHGLQDLIVDPGDQPIRIVAAALDRAGSDASEPEVVDGAPPADRQATRRTRQVEDASPSEEDVRTPRTPDWLRTPVRERTRRQRVRDIAAMRFYRATFTQEVRIWSGGDPQRPDQIATGDELIVLFSLEHSGLNESVGRTVTSAAPSSGSTPPVSKAFARPLDLRHQLVADTFAVFADDRDAIIPAPSDDDLYISFTGRLTIRPITETTAVLKSNDDVHLELHGQPVTLIDRTRNVRVACGMVAYNTATDTLSLARTADVGLTMMSAELTAAGELFEFREQANRGFFVGPGTMHLTGGAAEEMVEGVDALDAAVLEEGGLNIGWSRRVRLIFADDSAGGNAARLERAAFEGDVTVNEERFDMESDVLRVAFEPGGSNSAAPVHITRIEADGSVHVRGLDEQGREMESAQLLVLFQRDDDAPDQRPRPHRIIATGDAVVRDATQEVRAAKLIAELVEDTAGADEIKPRRAGATGFDRVKVSSFRAEEDVKLTLENGTRAFGDLLVADLEREIVDLTGEMVIVEGEQDGLEFRSEGEHARVERVAGRATIDMYGGGTAEIIDYRIDGVPGNAVLVDGANGNDAREPVPTQTVHVTWTDKLHYDEGPEGGTSMLTVWGDVHATSKTALEDNSIESVILQLEFAQEPVVDDAFGPGDGGGAAGDHDRRLVLRRMVAKGDAKLESRTWQTPERTGPPRIVYIAGQHVEYDQQTLKAHVPGAGRLFVLDHWTDDATPPAQGADRATEGLAGKGQTLFEWTGAMTMKQFVDDRYEVSLSGLVTMLHDPLSREENAQLACDTLDVTLKRRAGGERLPGLDFGGSTEVVKFEAVGAVFLDAYGTIVESHRIEYHDASHSAEIFGSDARPAEITPRGKHSPQRARRFRWDLLNDRITIIDLSGSIPRGGR